MNIVGRGKGNDISMDKEKNIIFKDVVTLHKGTRLGQHTPAFVSSPPMRGTRTP